MNATYFTDRLILKVLQSSDAEQVLAFYEKNRNFLEPHEPLRDANFYSTSFHKANLACEFDAFCKNLYMRYWIFEKDFSDIPIGSICLSNFKKGAFKCCDLGYKLDEHHCHKGYMYEALNYLIPIVCEQYPLHRVQAFVMPDNNSSITLLNRLNFKEEGYLSSYAQINGKWTDHLIYSYLAD